MSGEKTRYKFSESNDCVFGSNNYRFEENSGAFERRILRKVFSVQGEMTTESCETRDNECAKDRERRHGRVS